MRAGCIPFHRLQCGRAGCISFASPAVLTCRVYLFCITCSVNVQGISLCTACSVESLWTRSVLLSIPALWTCRVYPCPLLAAWTCRVHRLHCLPRCLQGVSLSTFVNCVEMTDCPASGKSGTETKQMPMPEPVRIRNKSPVHVQEAPVPD